MSPIPSVATAFVLSTTTPLIALDPDSVAQSASAMSQHLLGTGGLVFAVVAIASVAGYFYYGRGAVNSSQTSNTWTTLRSFLSYVCPRGSAATSTGIAGNWPIDLEVGPQHVSMVYARFFHPTFWNPVEFHPATVSAPAIYVEDEANEVPVSDPKPSGMNSFLDMDDDGDGDDATKCARESKNPERPRVEVVPPYDTSSSTNVNFSSQIIGTTVRRGAFLFVPGEEDDSSETSSEDSSSDSEEDIACSCYDATLRTPLGSSDDGYETPPSDPEFDFDCSPYDGIFTTPPGSSDDVTLSDSELAYTCSSYDEIVTTQPRFSPNTRRYGMADAVDLAQTLKETVLEDGYGLVPTVSPPTGLCDISGFLDTDSAMSYRHLERLGYVDDEPGCDIGTCDSRDGLRCDPSNSHDLRGSPADSDTFTAHHGGPDLMRELLEVLRDPDMDCTPRALSEDSDYEYSEDEGGGEIPRLTCTWGFDGTRRISLESTPSTPTTNSNMSDKEWIYPLTPPLRFAMSDGNKVRRPLPVPPCFNDVHVASPTSSESPAFLQSKGYVYTHRRNRSLYGPQLPLVALPRI